ncbi:MspA family porin [Mycobacterium sp. ITM-2016-00316]|uniref:MspA family porin n=1 Tax=Mycobacterium sp. ITM-2016-00316 TaxID=2099695 RepID=UPI001E579BC1|nr:MspA family porin [Mycobacterium sp. ITM-2016-00316]WNG84035.1 MspA family porin [Mycobacterium sp. ITM-2016-00316]
MTFRNAAVAAAVSVAMLSCPAALAQAEVVVVPDVTRTTTTVDGWQVTLTMTEARIDAVPNMAGAPYTKEGYLSARFTLSVEGAGVRPVDSGQLVVGAQLGCQIDLSDGLDLGVGFDTDLFDDTTVLGVGPDIGTTLRSGGIATVGLGVKSLKGSVATISVQDAHVQVDECGGLVTARLFASAQTSSEVSDDALNVYGQVLPL